MIGTEEHARRVAKGKHMITHSPVHTENITTLINIHNALQYPSGFHKHELASLVEDLRGVIYRLDLEETKRRSNEIQ